MSGSLEYGGYHAVPLTAHSESDRSEKPESSVLVEEKVAQPRNVLSLFINWRWEIFTYLLGTSAYVAIVVILVNARNKQPVYWYLGNEYFIGIPTIIAALAQVAQSALLVPVSYCIGQLKWKWFQTSNKAVDIDRFDLASRGPDGSIRLLFRFSWRQCLVSLGCFATILMLVVPTFVQTAVKIGTLDGEVYDIIDASTNRAFNAFMNPSKMVRLSTINPNGSTSQLTVDQTLGTALRSWTPEPQVYCSGQWEGRCTWEPFKNLGVCVSTENITKDIKVDNGQVSLAALQPFLPATGDHQLFQAGSYVYPRGNISQQGLSQALPTTSINSGTNLPNLAEVYYLFNDGCIDRLSTSNNLDSKKWKAYKGRLQFCVQTLQVEHASSGSSRVTAATTDLTWSRTTKFNETAFCTKVGSEKDEYCVSEALMESVSVQMNSLFNASAFIDPSNRDFITYNSELASSLFQEVKGETWNGSPLCNAKRDGGQNPNPYTYEGLNGLRLRLENIAESLRNTFRRDLNHDAEEIPGTMKIKKTALLVDFRWLILPAAIYITITIFFVATIVTTRAAPTWKNSPMPMLRVVDSDVGVDGSGEEVRRRAKEVSLRLRRIGGGWQMVDSRGLEGR